MHGPLTARDLLDQGAHRINGAFANTPVLRAEMLVLLGDLYRRIDELGAATPLLTEGLQLAEETGDPTIRLEARLGKGLLDVQANRPEDALAEFDAAERMFEDAGRIPEDLHGQLVMHRTHTLSGTGKTQEAVSYAEGALARARASTTLPPESLLFYLRAVGSGRVIGGLEQRAQESLDEALTLRSGDKLPPPARLPVHSARASFALARGGLEPALHIASEALELAEQV